MVLRGLMHGRIPTGLGASGNVEELVPITHGAHTHFGLQRQTHREGGRERET